MSQDPRTSYRGPDRRRRMAYMTRNTEYHLESGICVAVRDRATGNCQLCHGALGLRLSGVVRRKPGIAPFPALEPPEVGDGLFFAIEDENAEDVLTSNLLSIERPQKTTVLAYPV